MIRTYHQGNKAVLVEEWPGGRIRFPVPRDSGVQRIVRNPNRIIYFDTESLRYHAVDAAGTLLETGDPCPYLGDEVERNGITIKVKCGCGGTEEKEQWHAAHRCAVKGRCLPTLVPADITAWRERHESSLYHLCHGCESKAATPPPTSNPF